jgi:hypothetical protein
LAPAASISTIKFVYLKGYAQRSTDEWAGLGQAYPDWMHDFNGRSFATATPITSAGCTSRRSAWMSDAFDKYGIVNVCPAGDKEGDVQGRQWDQRVRSHARFHDLHAQPSQHLLLGGGQQRRLRDHMKQMVDLKKQWDPTGGASWVAATLKDDPAATFIAEYFGIMIGQDPPRTNANGPRTSSAPTATSAATGARSSKPRISAMRPPAVSGMIIRRPISASSPARRIPITGTARPSPSPRQPLLGLLSNRISNTDPRTPSGPGTPRSISDSNADGRQDSAARSAASAARSMPCACPRRPSSPTASCRIR